MIQVCFPQAKLRAGPATAVTVSTWIAVGTKNGLVLIFDVSQSLKWFIDLADVTRTKQTSPRCETCNNQQQISFDDLIIQMQGIIV